MFKHGQYAEAAVSHRTHYFAGANLMHAMTSKQHLQDRYGDGLIIAPEGQRIRAVLYANRAACCLELQQYKEAVTDCSAAIDIDGAYLKAWHRRAKAYESLDDMDRALIDAQKACSTCCALACCILSAAQATSCTRVITASMQTQEAAFCTEATFASMQTHPRHCVWKLQQRPCIHIQLHQALRLLQQ